MGQTIGRGLGEMERDKNTPLGRAGGYSGFGRDLSPPGDNLDPIFIVNLQIGGILRGDFHQTLGSELVQSPALSRHGGRMILI